MLVLISAVLLSLAAPPVGNRGGQNGSESKANAKTTPGWTSTGSLTNSRQSHTATLLPSGKVLVAGGDDNNGNYLSSAELYDPATGNWNGTRSFGTAR